MLRRQPTQAVAAVVAHRRAAFAGHQITQRRPVGKRIHQRVRHLVVQEIAPGPTTASWTYASLGLWDATHDAEGHGSELLLAGPRRDERLAELVTMAAFFHAGAVEQRLAPGRAVPIGQPWLSGSRCDHLLALPLDTCTCRRATRTSCGWSR